MNEQPINRVLVTGGAGYIGSHTCWQLIDAGYAVTVIDNFYSGQRWAVHPKAKLIEGDAGDQKLVREVLRDGRIDAVIHFAGHIVVPESVEDPLKYYRNNTCVSRNLIESCVMEGIANFVFSSTAAVYGIPQNVPVDEMAPLHPINPYGFSKLMTEWILQDVAARPVQSKPFRYISLRYFNAAGARQDGMLGQATPEATHLIKVACQAACGLRDHVAVFGADYDTSDGTCVRDYIHVEDLASAHLAALRHIARGGTSLTLNCGYGRGATVLEVLEMVKRVSGVDFSVRHAQRRAGDPPALVSDSGRIQKMLDWAPQYANLETICRSAFLWEKNLSRRREGVESLFTAQGKTPNPLIPPYQGWRDDAEIDSNERRDPDSL